jgi:hypothetical protein
VTGRDGSGRDAGHATGAGGAPAPRRGVTGRTASDAGAGLVQLAAGRYHRPGRNADRVVARRRPETVGIRLAGLDVGRAASCAFAEPGLRLAPPSMNRCSPGTPGRASEPEEFRCADGYHGATGDDGGE